MTSRHGRAMYRVCIYPQSQRNGGSRKKHRCPYLAQPTIKPRVSFAASDTKNITTWAVYFNCNMPTNSLVVLIVVEARME